MPHPTAPNPALCALDLFCGIGGLTHGLVRSGVPVRAGYDSDPNCRYAYAANNPGSSFQEADVRDVRPDDLAAHYPSGCITVLAGCAPCQPFSAHTRRRDGGRDDSPFLAFTRLAAEVRPHILVMENVPGLSRQPAFTAFTTSLAQRGYRSDHAVVSCMEYGVPQTRRRLVLLASRLGPIRLPAPVSERPTVADCIGGLPPIAAGETHPDDAAHAALALPPRNLRRLRQSKPGGTWRDWDDALVTPSQRRHHYPAPYGRMRWDAPAPTITTQFRHCSTGRFGHPEQDRALSVREGALLQTFPANYAFTDPERPHSLRTMARHIGNAVPVRLAVALGDAIQAAVQHTRPALGGTK